MYNVCVQPDGRPTAGTICVLGGPSKEGGKGGGGGAETGFGMGGGGAYLAISVQVPRLFQNVKSGSRRASPSPPPRSGKFCKSKEIYGPFLEQRLLDLRTPPPLPF